MSRNPVRGKRLTEFTFWQRVAVLGPTECWEWKGGKTSFGYGRKFGVSETTAIEIVKGRRWKHVPMPGEAA